MLPTIPSVNFGKWSELWLLLCELTACRWAIESQVNILCAQDLPWRLITVLTAAVVTNSINAVVLALATASLGGIFSSTATDMGTDVDYSHLLSAFFSYSVFCRVFSIGTAKSDRSSSLPKHRSCMLENQLTWHQRYQKLFRI